MSLPVSPSSGIRSDTVCQRSQSVLTAVRPYCLPARLRPTYAEPISADSPSIITEMHDCRHPHPPIHHHRECNAVQTWCGECRMQACKDVNCNMAQMTRHVCTPAQQSLPSQSTLKHPRASTTTQQSPPRVKPHSCTTISQQCRTASKDACMQGQLLQ